MKSWAIFAIVCVILLILSVLWVNHEFNVDAQRACLVQGMEGCK